MQKWFSAFDDAIIQRQRRVNPSRGWGGMSFSQEVDPNVATGAPPRRPRVPGRACSWRDPIRYRRGARPGRGAAGGTPGEAVRHCSAPEDPIFRFSSLYPYFFPGILKSRDMSRKRHRLVPETIGLKRRRKRGPEESDPPRGEPGSARAAVSELMQLFPRGLFEDALPPIVLRSQVYSLVPDRTVADRQLKELQEQGEIRIVQLGFDLDAHGIIFTEDYRTRVCDCVLKACDGRPYAGAVQKFLASVLPACGDLSFQQEQMTQTFGFRDSEITHLVNAGVLTVRDAGSWWLAVPGAGRFIKYFVKGRQAVLGMVRKAKYRELLLSELLGRRAPAMVRLGLTYHVHDLIGAQLVDCISTTSGTLLRLPET
uniref:Serine/threonine kinase 19 n=1 Tax=Saimiri boliviensis boliviensis TaxID=39432 RepID=A0A2K6UTL0_SAIBB